jgi:hypothetical protein
MQVSETPQQPKQLWQMRAPPAPSPHDIKLIIDCLAATELQIIICNFNSRKLCMLWIKCDNMATHRRQSPCRHRQPKCSWVNIQHLLP